MVLHAHALRHTDVVACVACVHRVVVFALYICYGLALTRELEKAGYGKDVPTRVMPKRAKKDT